MTRTHTPKLCRHRSQQQGYVTIQGREHYLGHWPSKSGKQAPAAVRSAYDDLIAKWLANGRRLPDERPPITVNELLLAYLKWAETYYVPKRAKDDQNRFIRYAAATVRDLFGRTPAAEFGPKRLCVVRQRMVERGWCRSTINAQVDRVRRIFKWGVAEELVPGTVYHALRAVESIRRGTPGVRDTEHVRPVPLEVVDATLPFLPLTVQSMVRVQMMTGMRPGEVCQLRASDIDSSEVDGIWTFRPAQHKTEHHGHDRVIMIGPEARKELGPFMSGADEYIFCPRSAENVRNAERRKNRTSPITPSQRTRQPKVNPNRRKRERYDETSYRNAVYRACDKAFPPPGELARTADESVRQWLGRLTPDQRVALRGWRRKHRWHPNQLRHLAATRIRREFGIEAARAILGHSRLTTTEVYAEVDQLKAAQIMTKIG